MISVVGFLLMASCLSYGQTVIKKAPGDLTTISWAYDPSKEALITGFRIYRAPTSTGTFTAVAQTAATSRAITFPMSFLPNSVKVFFEVRAYKASATSFTESTGTAGDQAIECSFSGGTPGQVKRCWR